MIYEELWPPSFQPTETHNLDMINKYFNKSGNNVIHKYSMVLYVVTLECMEIDGNAIRKSSVKLPFWISVQNLHAIQKACCLFQAM